MSRDLFDGRRDLTDVRLRSLVLRTGSGSDLHPSRLVSDLDVIGDVRDMNTHTCS